MSFDVLNPSATVTLAFRGLTAFCFNQSHNAGQGRWEIAIPQFTQHVFLMRIPGVGVLEVGPAVKTIQIKDRVGVPVTTPKFEVNPFDRKNKATSNPKDYRWLVDFTTEVPHGTSSIIKRSDDPLRPDVTMLYITNAVGYTKLVQDNPMILATQKDTCPVVDREPRPLPNSQAGRVLDGILNPFGFSATALGIDIESPAGGGVVDIIFDNGIVASIPKMGKPQEVLISNLEPDNLPSPAGAIVSTVNNKHGRGDFFRYYELFKVTGERLHLWERFAETEPAPLEARTGDCHGVGVGFSNLDDLL